MTGCGAARSARSSRPSSSACAPDMPKAHESQMPAFGTDGMLKRDEIVSGRQPRARVGQPADAPGADLAAGRKIYADNCAVCHGAEGKGNKELGAPNLTDGIWLFGSDEAAIVEVIANSRGGVMPAWAGRLDPMTIKALDLLCAFARRRGEMTVRAEPTMRPRAATRSADCSRSPGARRSRLQSEGRVAAARSGGRMDRRRAAL